MFYVYELIDPRDNTPFYVGKGTGNRAYSHIQKNKQGRETDNPYKDNVIRQILSESLEPIIKYVFWSDDGNAAYDYEEVLIQKYGRRRFEKHGILTNLCKNNRPPHDTYSNARRKQYRAAMIGNTINTGRIRTPEEKIKRALSLKHAYDSGKRVVTDKMRLASSVTHKGKQLSTETKLKISATRLSRNLSTKGKTLVDIYGKEKAAHITNKLKNRPATNKKSITINSIVYDTIKSAAVALGISEYKAKKLNDFKPYET